MGALSGNGYVQRRRGILGHLQDGRLTLLECGTHDVISMLADKATGIWFGSARGFAASCGAGEISERQARHLLESLEKKGYLKRFAKPRAHGNYPILVNKYEVTFGAHTGMRLNAAATKDWRRPVYESCAEHGVEKGVGKGAERSPFQEQELRHEKEITPSSARAQAPSQAAICLATLLHERILANSPAARVTVRQLGRWAKDVDLMLALDGRSEDQIRELIEWSQRDPFWKTNILSMGKLRQKFHQLSLKKESITKGGLTGDQLTRNNLAAAGHPVH